MTTSTNTIRRLTATLGPVAVAIVIGAPAAVAGHQDLGTKVALQQIEGAHTNEPAADRAGTRGIGEQTVGVDTSDAVSRYLRSHPAPDSPAVGRPVASRPAIHVPVASPRAFDWRDAGIGAGSALTLMLIALGGMVILLRRKPSGTRMLSS
jgi:hypothetical protein